MHVIVRKRLECNCVEKTVCVWKLHHDGSCIITYFFLKSEPIASCYEARLHICTSTVRQALASRNDLEQRMYIPSGTVHDHKKSSNL